MKTLCRQLPAQRRLLLLPLLFFALVGRWLVCAAGTASAAPPADLAPPPQGPFPDLPPAPRTGEEPPLPALDEELWESRGSFLYQPEGDRWRVDDHEAALYPRLRLPEDWIGPQPVTLFAPYLGPGPIRLQGKWPGASGYSWEPRFVFSGAYQLFALGIHENNDDLLALGHQLRLDFDLQLTGTERFHVQYRPVGRRASGGSYYAFTDPQGYVDQSTAEPDRYWFEGELGSILGSFLDRNHAWDWNIAAGKFPFAMHNQLLINDEVLGIVLSKNTFLPGDFSNLNVQGFYLFNDVDFDLDARGTTVGVHLQVDRHLAFYEATYAWWRGPAGRDAMHYAGISRTQFYGLYTVAARALFKFAPQRLDGDGQLFVLEINRSMESEQGWFGFHPALAYVNFFGATSGWRSLAGANFNRLATAFEVNPLVRIAAGAPPGSRWGISGGIQCFRRHEDESLAPEFAFESRDGAAIFGVGMRYQRKLSTRTWWELLVVANESSVARYDRYGALASWFVLW